MKKFGTPSGAAPGAANENVGFAGVGTPLALVVLLPLLLPLPLFLCFGLLLLLLLLLPLPPEWVLDRPCEFPGWLCDDGFCVLPGCDG